MRGRVEFQAKFLLAGAKPRQLVRDLVQKGSDFVLVVSTERRREASAGDVLRAQWPERAFGPCETPIARVSERHCLSLSRAPRPKRGGTR